MSIDVSDATMLINTLRENGGIPISVNMIATTEWTQYLLLIGVTLISSIFVFIFMWDGYIKPIFGRIYLSYLMIKIKKITGRNAIIIKHTTMGFFQQSMIDIKTLHDLEKAVKSFKGKPFDIILHTPGGYVFYAQLLSKAIKKYGQNIRAFVPFYAMSGGTMLALSCDEIIMGNFACLGPVDPQLGGFFSSGSAKSWKEVLRRKGRKADDSTIQYAYIGEQYTKTIKNDVRQLLSGKIQNNDQLETAIDILTDGQLEHAYQLDAQKLSDIGIHSTPMSDELQDLLSKLICNNWIEGVDWA